MPRYRIGCSGFLYDSWRGTFYPETLPHKKWLSFYMAKFKTVELNVTFYRLLKKEAFERWYKETPPNFSFCLKGSRFITHVKKLKDVELPLATFFNATAPLLEKLEVILWQLPPNLKLNMKNLEDFVESLKKYPVRHVFEFRHKSWLVKKVFNLLSASNIAVCIADWPEFITDLPATADFVYIRRHGEGGNYATNYTTDQLKADARKIKEFMKLGKDVYCYFNNDAFAYAPKNARELISILESTIPKSLLDKAEAARAKPRRLKPLKKKEEGRKISAKKRVAAKKTSAKKIKGATPKIAAPKKTKPDKAKPKKAAPKKAKPKKAAPAKAAARKKPVKKPVPKKAVKPARKKTTAPKKAAPKGAGKSARKPAKKTVKKAVKKK